MGGANLYDSTSRFPKHQRVTLRFYEELNDFLPPEWQKRPFDFEFELPRSVKDLIESLGVPHVEVDLILVNGVSVDFNHLVSDGDRISVYPMFESLDIEPVTRLRPTPLRMPRFVLDVHLATLARKLRMLGFDSVYSNASDDDQLAGISAGERRILLTRDLGLLKRTQVSRGLFVRSTDPGDQLAEIVARLDLSKRINPFTRCIACNGTIRQLDEEETANVSRKVEAGIETSIPASVLRWCNTFHRCTSCDRYYWKGSHYTHMIDEIAELKSRMR